jgi:hypothetical protein
VVRGTLSSCGLRSFHNWVIGFAVIRRRLSILRSITRKTEEETCLAHSFVDDILDRQSLIVNGVAAIYSEADIRVLINTSVPVPMFLAPSAW